MKSISLLVFVLFFLAQNLFSSQQNIISYDPILAVVLMVKNEEGVIAKTLEPLLKSGIKDFFIFDTGSTDQTVKMAQEFFEKHNLERAYIAQEPFIDFATSRNRALTLAKEKFPNAAFFLMPDAEWYLHNGEKLLEFCAKHAQDGPDQPKGYLIRIFNDYIDFYTAKLIRGSLQEHFEGAVHEALLPPVSSKVPEDIYFELDITRNGVVKTQQRWIRDRDLLLKEHQKNPSDPRTMFYLAQTYQCLGDLKNAYDFYQKRIAIKSWEEEDFMARYRFAQIIERMAQTNDWGFAWPNALECYLQAYQSRPHRIEPLIKIASHYFRKNDMQLSFIFALNAAQIVYPKEDVLFVEKDVYDFSRYELLSHCALCLGEFNIGEWATCKALSSRPNSSVMKNNLSFYLRRKIKAEEKVGDSNQKVCACAKK